MLQFDAVVTSFISNMIPHIALFDYFFAFLSLKGNSIIIWAIVIALLIFFEEKKDKIFIWYLLGSVLLVSFINNLILKNIFMRQRPIPPEGTSLLMCPTDFSFPSGHAAGAFAGAVIIAHFDEKRKWLYYTIASLVALSRIYLGCHYLLDVIGGAIVGITISSLILLLHKKKFFNMRF